MSLTADQVSDAFVQEMSLCLDECVERIQHCVDQLSDEQIWWRPAESLNAIGNLLLHLCGNLRQWIVKGVGQTEDHRNRPLEFSTREPISKVILIGDLASAVREVNCVMALITSDQLLETRRIQGFEVSVMRAVVDSISHFKGHTQEIIYLTRIQLGDDYQFHWQPSTPEQGA